MPAVGLTDYGNMMGAFYFLRAVQQKNRVLQEKFGSEHSPIKAVVGCEMYLSEQYQQKKVYQAKSRSQAYPGFSGQRQKGLPQSRKAQLRRFHTGLLRRLSAGW